MGFIFITLMIVVASILYIVGNRFDRIERGDDVMYYEGDLPIYDVVEDNDGMEITTQLGRTFTVWDLLRGNFFTIKKYNL